ncbi:MAG: hypothetical protein EH225_02800 [Calditrichaeota bacterium]|nr:hypothetical protein [Calditrichota bacterium]RQW06760.1 MAG: hypothetical protein EH225_02800 [Calditrichota bacterium]
MIEPTSYLRFILIFTTLFFWLLNCSSENRYLPEKLLDYKRINLLRGKEAKDVVDHMHLKEVTPEINRIGIYQNVSGPLTIYISEYTRENTAKSEMRKMASKISDGNNPFVGGETVLINGKQVLRYFGMGQTHFIFTDRENMLWLSVNTVRGKAIIEHYLNFIK